MIATQILVGRLQMPHIHDMASVYGTAVYKQIEGMFKAMWDAYLTKGPDTAEDHSGQANDGSEPANNGSEQEENDTILAVDRDTETTTLP